jgi:hypothetical protein
MRIPLITPLTPPMTSAVSKADVEFLEAWVDRGQTVARSRDV